MSSKKTRHTAKLVERAKSIINDNGTVRRKLLMVAFILFAMFLIPVAISIATSISAPILENNSLSPSKYQTAPVQESGLKKFDLNVEVVRVPKAEPTTVKTDVIYYYHNDHLGQPVYMTDESDNIVWRREQDPSSEETFQRGTITENLRGPGQYCDEETGKIYNMARTYDPNTGRYTTPDPLGQIGDVNPYSHVGNNPVNRVDPSGKIDTLRAKVFELMAEGRFAEAMELAEAGGATALAQKINKTQAEVQMAMNRFPAAGMQCRELTNELIEIFKKAGANPRLVQIQDLSRYPFMVNQNNIAYSANKYHEAVQIGDMVFDSAITGPSGMNYNQYINTLMNLGVNPQVTIK